MPHYTNGEVLKKKEQKIVSYLTENLLNHYDLHGPNFDGTPERVQRMLNEFFNTPKPNMTTFPLEGKAGMIVVKDHTAWSFCPHHLLPVRYIFKIGYIPEERVLGLSKLARVADYVVTRLPLQEDAAEMVADIIEEAIHPKGIGVVVDGEHLCMKMRGVRSTNATAHSSFLTGCFLIEQSCREEFLSL